MTVSEVVKVLKNAKTIALCYDGNSFPLEKDNTLMMDAYGDYIVSEIQSVGIDTDGYYEVSIAMTPVKAFDKRATI